MPFIVMELFTMQQHILVVQTYYENDRSVKNTFRNLRNSFGQHARPSVCNSAQLYNTINRFEKTVGAEYGLVTSHISRQTIYLLVIKFGEEIISRNSDENWLARSCD